MAISLCIIAAILWSLFDLFRKVSLKYFGAEFILLLFTLSQIILFIFWAYIEKNNFFLNQYIVYGLCLIILSTLSNVLFLKAIEFSEISLAIPLLSFTPLFSTIFAYMFLDEKLFFSDYLAIIIIIIGALTLYSKSMQFLEFYITIKNFYINKSSRYMFIVSIIWSLAPTLDKICLKYTSIPLHGLIQSLGIFLLLILINYKTININFNKNKKLSFLFFTVLIGILANVLQFYAILMNYISTMEAIKRTIGQLGSIILGRLFLKEIINLNKIIGVSFMIIGVLVLLNIN